jgi:hypothetical protein
MGKQGQRRRVGAQWEAQAAEAFLDLRGWRELHPRATLKEIEQELDRRLEQLRARMLADLALASTAADLQREPAARACCPACGEPLQLSERHVQNLLEIYLSLLQASGQDPRPQLAPVVEEYGGLVLSVDGLQPEQGNEQLWVVREVNSGTVLAAANLQQATAPVLADLLRLVARLELPVLGVISDAQQCIRLAVAEVFPSVPHQLCQYHALREAAEPLWELDRHLAVEAKQELRSLREVEERTRARGDPPDPASAVVLDSVLALRQTLRERGTLPFDFAGLRVMAELADLEQTLDRCLQKRGTRAWPGSAR